MIEGLIVRYGEFTDISEMGQNLTISVNDYINIDIGKINYVGPETRLYFWVGIVQDGIVRFEEYDSNGVPVLKMIEVEDCPAPVEIEILAGFTLLPRVSLSQAPIVQEADLVIAVLWNHDLSMNSWLTRKTYLAQYNVLQYAYPGMVISRTDPWWQLV